MCGRFTLAARPADLARAFPWAPPPPTQLDERYNVAPTQEVLACLDASPQEEAFQPAWHMLRWGLVPHWAGSPQEIGARFINVRLDTAMIKPAFRESYAHRRCVVPATGFYEWHAIAKERRPFFARPTGEPVLAMAGLWSTWHGENERVDSCAILTRTAIGPVGEIHDRMPVLLCPERQEAWLREPLPPEALLESEVVLTAYAVSPYVNRAANEGPQCIAPV